MTERRWCSPPKRVFAGSNPVGRTMQNGASRHAEASRRSRLGEIILDILFGHGPMRWEELWDMIPDQFRAYPYSYCSYSGAVGRLYRTGWVVSGVPREPIALTATAWLRLGVGRYPWNYPR